MKPETVAEACERVKITEDEWAQLLNAHEREHGRVVPVPVPARSLEEVLRRRASTIAQQLAEGHDLEIHSDAGGFPILVVPRTVIPIRAACDPVPGQTPGDPADLETLAAAEHESWSGWMRYMLPRIERELLDQAKTDSELVEVFDTLNELPCVKRWIRQYNTPYAELPDEEKESDRKEAREKLKVYRPEVTA